MPEDVAGIHAAGAAFWPLAVARELDDALLHLRLNEPALGLLVLRTEGDVGAVLAADALLEAHRRGLAGARSAAAAEARVEAAGSDVAESGGADRAGSCFAGSLAELAFAADRAVMQADGGGDRVERAEFWRATR